MAEQPENQSKGTSRAARARAKAARAAAAAARGTLTPPEPTSQDSADGDATEQIEDVEILGEDRRAGADDVPASNPVTPVAVLDHFRASRLPIGDVVMAVRQRYDLTRNAPSGLELRVFLASAADRAQLVELDADALAAHDGGLLFAAVTFPPEQGEYRWDAAEGRRARLTRLALHGATAEERVATAVHLVDWTIGALEAELRFAGIATLDIDPDGVDDSFASELALRGYAAGAADDDLRRVINDAVNGAPANA